MGGFNAIDALYNEPKITCSTQGGIYCRDGSNLFGDAVKPVYSEVEELKHEIASIRDEYNPALINHLKQTIEHQNASLKELRSEVAYMRNVFNSLIAINQINKIKTNNEK